MAVNLYFSPRSPSCQTILLVGQCIGLNFELIPTAPMQGDTMKPDYIQMNPQHTIPTLVDEDGFTIWESRTIARYLIQKYSKGKNKNLYPNELKKRINVDKMLDFDIGTMYKCLMDYTASIFINGKPNESAVPKLNDALLVLERCLGKIATGWVANDEFSLADIFLFMSINTLLLINYDLSTYPEILKWIPAVKSSIPNYKAIGAAAEADFKSFHESLKYQQ